jgi:diacylglycerol O-acyltransferase
MSDSDSLLWTIGADPVLRSPIVVVLTLDRSPDWDALLGRVERLVATEPRLSAIPTPAPPRNPLWRTDPNFDLALHLRHIVAPPPADLRYVLDTAALMGSTDFDTARPLWESTLVSGLTDGTAAVILKIHHAVIDGIAGMALLAGLLGSSAQDSLTLPPPPQPKPTPHHLPRLLSMPYQVTSTLFKAATHPLPALAALRADLTTMIALVAPASAPLSPLMTRRSATHHYEVLEFPAHTLATAAHAQHATLNDIFLTGLLGGLTRYHAAHGTILKSLRVLVPINIRTDSDPGGGNRFVPARFVLDATNRHPRAALAHVRTAMAAWKHTPSLAVADPLTNVLPDPLAIRLFGSMLKGDDVVGTNVPGPPLTSYLGGAKLNAFYAFAPTSGSAVNIALITSADAEYLGINIDSAALSDPAVLTHCLAEAFAELIALPALP